MHRINLQRNDIRQRDDLPLALYLDTQLSPECRLRFHEYLLYKPTFNIEDISNASLRMLPAFMDNHP